MFHSAQDAAEQVSAEQKTTLSSILEEAKQAEAEKEEKFARLVAELKDRVQMCSKNTRHGRLR